MAEDDVTLASTTDSEAEVREALGLEADAEPKEPVVKADDPPPVAAKAEDDPAKESVQKDAKAKPTKSQTRINKLAREKYEAMAERDALAQRLAALEKAETAKQPVVATEKPVETAVVPPKPTEEQFQTVGEFIEALTDWKASVKESEIITKVSKQLESQTDAGRRAAAQADAERQQVANAATYMQRVEAAKAQFSDFDAVAELSTKLPVSQAMNDYIKHAEHGVAIGYYLAKNPAESDRIAKMNAGPAYAAIGRLEERLEAGTLFPAAEEVAAAPEKVAEKPPEKTAPVVTKPTLVTKAPNPTPKVGSSAVATEEDPEQMDYPTYKKWFARTHGQAAAH